MNRTFFIAEVGVNHNGRLDMALALVDAAAEAGADAVKFQTFKAERLVSAWAPKAEYQKAGAAQSESQFDMLHALELDRTAHEVLAARCAAAGVEFLSTPFDAESLAMLLSLGVTRLKVSSGDLTNAPLLLEMARSELPVILSTGMSSLGEVEEALGVLAFGYAGEGAPGQDAFRQAYASQPGQAALKDKVTLLHCTTQYPTPFEDVHLLAMDTLRAAFGLPVGYSDHTEGETVPLSAVARGASVVEKHFTLDRTLPGPDHRASMEPALLGRLIRQIRQVHLALGRPLKGVAPTEALNRLVARRSIVAARPIQEGETFSLENLALKRPGGGLPPVRLWDLVGMVATTAYAQDEAIRL